MNDRDVGSPQERPTAEQVEFFAREMRARAWSQHVFSPLRDLVRRIAARLVSRASRAPIAAEDTLPDASART